MLSRNIATNPRPVDEADLATPLRDGDRMRITGVKTHIVDTPIPEEHRVRIGAGYKLARQAAFVELTTDEGLKGYGPCSFGSASLDLGSVATLCDNTFARALVGEDPHRIEYLWDKIYYGSIVRVHGPRSVGVAILSAIDIALWDLKGKALGVADLPAARRRLPGSRAGVLQLRLLVDAGARRGAGAGVPRPGLQGLQGQGRPRRRQRHRLAARDPRGTSAPTSTSWSTRTSATRATSR